MEKVDDQMCKSIADGNVNELRRLLATHYASNAGSDLFRHFGKCLTMCSLRIVPCALVLVFVEHGFDIKAYDTHHRNSDPYFTAGHLPSLHMACRESNVELLRLLLQNGADVNMLSIYTYPQLFADIDTFFNWPRPFFAPQSAPRTVLFYACTVKMIDAEIVRALLEEGADPNVYDCNREYPLSIACKAGRADIVNILLVHGAHVNVMDNKWNRPLYAALCSGFPAKAIIELLLRAGGRIIEVKGRAYGSYLHKAVLKPDKLDVCRVLIESGAVVDWKNASGCTPLIHACQNGDIELVRLLLSANADPNECNRFCETPFTCSLRASLPSDDERYKLCCLISAAGGTVSNTVLLLAKRQSAEIIALLETQKHTVSSLSSICRRVIRREVYEQMPKPQFVTPAASVDNNDLPDMELSDEDDKQSTASSGCRLFVECPTVNPFQRFEELPLPIVLRNFLLFRTD